MYVAWGMSGGAVVCEPHEPQTDPGMGSPGPDVDGPGGDGGRPRHWSWWWWRRRMLSRPGRACLLSATAGTQSKKLVLLLVPSQLQLFNPNIHAGFKAFLEPLRAKSLLRLKPKPAHIRCSGFFAPHCVQCNDRSPLAEHGETTHRTKELWRCNWNNL